MSDQRGTGETEELRQLYNMYLPSDQILYPSISASTTQLELLEFRHSLE